MRFVLLASIFFSLIGCQKPNKRELSQRNEFSCKGTPDLTKYFKSIGDYNPEMFQWIMPKDEPKAVVFMLHGLNLLPSKMNEFGQSLADKDTIVFRGSLAGHRKLDEKINSFDTWYRDFKVQYCAALNKSEELGIPLHFFGFSLGALTGSYFVHAHQNVNVFDKMILIAPAISVKWYGEIPAFIPFGKNFELPSSNLESYRAEDGTSLGAYRSMKFARKKLKDAKKELNLPTLVFLDPKDELVSYRKTRKFINSKGLDNWDLIKISNRGHKLKKSFHHLVIDKKSLGDREYNRMIKAIYEHLGL